MGRASRAVWAKRVERWGDSGLTAKQFAAEIDVSPQLGRRDTRRWCGRMIAARGAYVSRRVLPIREGFATYRLVLYPGAAAAS